MTIHLKSDEPSPLSDEVQTIVQDGVTEAITHAIQEYWLLYVQKPEDEQESRRIYQKQLPLAHAICEELSPKGDALKTVFHAPKGKYGVLLTEVAQNWQDQDIGLFVEFIEFWRC